MHLEVRRRVREEREARAVRLREPVERERRDAAHDRLRGRAGDAVGCHAGPQFGLDRRHALDRALEAHRAPQLLRLAARETGDGHCDPQQLLLEERHAEGALENRLQRRMRVRDGLAPGAAVQVRMHHLPDDRARADDRHLDDEVVEARRLHPRQGRHLRSALDLEDADRVRPL